MLYKFNKFVNAALQASHETEVPQLLTTWATVSAAAAMLGRVIHIPFGTAKIYPNFYCLLVGSAGARKSTAINKARKYLEAAGYKAFAAEKVTLQKFLLDMSGIEVDQIKLKNGDFELDDLIIDGLGFRQLTDEKKESAAYLIHGEFADFIGQNNYAFINTLGEFWDKDSPYSYRVKNNQSFEIKNIIVNILGGATPGGFNLMFPAEIADQGMLSRMIIVCTKPSTKKVSWPVSPPVELTEQIVDGFKSLKKLSGEVTFTPEAKKLVETIYQCWEGFDDPRFDGYATRRHTQFLKVAMICAAMRTSLEINVADAVQAHTLLSYTERLMPIALGGYGKGKYSDVAHKILFALRGQTKPMPMQALYKMFGKDLDDPKHLIMVLSGLLSAGQIQSLQGGYLPLQETAKIKAADKYADWTLLAGIADDAEVL